MPLILGAGDEAEIVTRQADAEAWFVGADGQALDPRHADDAEAIADAVKVSVRTPGNEEEA